MINDIYRDQLFLHRDNNLWFQYCLSNSQQAHSKKKTTQPNLLKPRLRWSRGQGGIIYGVDLDLNVFVYWKYKQVSFPPCTDMFMKLLSWCRLWPLRASEAWKGELWADLLEPHSDCVHPQQMNLTLMRHTWTEWIGASDREPLVETCTVTWLLFNSVYADRKATSWTE